MIQALLASMLAIMFVQNPMYGDRIANLPEAPAAKLAEAFAPNKAGAIGRNKKSYFHVRFQRGMHHVADYGIVSKRVDVIERFVLAAEYAMQHQLASGDFSVEIPSELQSMGKPSDTDRVSGVAFFTASLGLGILALDTNTWFMTSPSSKGLRDRLSTLKPKLKSTLSFLKQNQSLLEAADRHAPNRLLFDAIAFISLGQILNDSVSKEIGVVFTNAAIRQIHENGYFIEGGGFDSSYNGVATALALRLALLDQEGINLKAIGGKAIAWQKGRVLATGEIST